MTAGPTAKANHLDDPRPPPPATVGPVTVDQVAVGHPVGDLGRF